MSRALGDRVAALWACAPATGLACLLLRWLLRLDDGQVRSRGELAARLPIVALIAAGMMAAMIELPSSNRQTGALAQAPVRLALCLMVPGLLGVGAAQGSGGVRAKSV